MKAYIFINAMRGHSLALTLQADLLLLPRAQARRSSCTATITGLPDAFAGKGVSGLSRTRVMP
jgi:hypothetical protein